MKDIKEFVELNDEELNQVSGGGLGKGSMKGWVCKNCGNVQGTWQEGGGCVVAPYTPTMCFNCGSIDSFEIRDL